jgi:hypothetical protein
VLARTQLVESAERDTLADWIGAMNGDDGGDE